MKLGIDEAGRGPVIGPMVMCAVVLDANQEKKLQEVGVRDSKLVIPEQRERYAKSIQQIAQSAMKVVTVKEIDQAVMSSSSNLNFLEAQVSVDLILELMEKVKVTTIYLDCPSKNLEAYKETVERLIQEKKKGRLPKIVCEHKADAKYMSVAAASILAKVKRDNEVRKLHSKVGVDFGSGYLTDPKTYDFMQTHFNDKKAKSIFRSSWQPIKDLRGGRQTLLVGSQEDLFEPLLKYGYSFVDKKNQYETVRMKGNSATIVKYTSGKLLVQGSPVAIGATKDLLKKLKIE